MATYHPMMASRTQEGRERKMKRKEQENINMVCESYWSDALKEFERECTWNDCKRLRTCTAYVYESEHYYFLRSYNTIVAIIVKGTDTCIDMLREVYGYTSTSAQHIAKFRSGRCFGGYGSGKWGCVTTLTAR